jgi:hypothetical protein
MSPPSSAASHGLSPHVQAAGAWLGYAERHWHRHPQQPALGYFGTGTVAIQSLEAAAEHAFICATLACHAEPDADNTDNVAGSGLTRAGLLDRALAGLRYLAATHVTGEAGCVPGASGAVNHSGRPAPPWGGNARRQWGGDGWSPVPAFFLFLVADALGEALPEPDAAAVRRVLAYEADANLADQRCTVLEHHGYFRQVPPIPTGRFGTSWPESNAWRGALLAAARLTLPDHPRAPRWDDSMKRHFMNALSVPQDAASDAVVDGRPVREWFVGANVHPHFALEHHGFFHPCYAARTMEFMVLAADAFERRGLPPPECTTHHLLDEWRLLQRLLLWQGRLAYPAGQDHHRYGWGLTYLLPVLAWLQRHDGDRIAASFEQQLAAVLLYEQRHNGDGSFVRERMGALLEDTPHPLRRAGDRSRVLYYRAEADPPFYLLLAQRLHQAGTVRDRWPQAAPHAVPGPRPVAQEAPEPAPVSGDVAPPITGTVEEPDAGLVFRRDPGRFVSWSWNAYPDVAQGLFIPRHGDHLAEWNGNLAPAFVVLDAPATRAVVWQRTTTFHGGFATLGTVRHAGGALAQHVLYVALPDGRSALYADEVRCRWALTLLHQEGLRLNLGNDLFNGYRRRLRFAGGEAWLVAGQPADARLRANRSPWLVVDDLLGVQFVDESDQSGEPWTVRTFPSRNATDMSAWYAILCRPLLTTPRAFPIGGLVQRTCVRLVANVAGDEWVAPVACRWRPWRAGEAPSLTIEAPGLDGALYRIDAGWGARAVTLQRR